MAKAKIDNEVFLGLVGFFREQLYREVAQMFEWGGLPDTVPSDYLERNLVRHGYLLYYDDPVIGNDILRCQVMGYNRHQLPTKARTFSPNTIDENITVDRNILRIADGGDVKERFNPLTDGCVILNMEFGQSLELIVDFYAEQLAMSQQAFNTNLLYANIPYIFQVSNIDTKQSIEKMFRDIYSGKPLIIMDSQVFADNKERAGIPTGIPFICKELLDIQNEIKMRFKQAIGFDTAGVDKAERVNTIEVNSNNQHTDTVVDIMLKQRIIAKDNINAFFGVNLTVKLSNEPEQQKMEEGDEEDGTSDSGVDETTNNSKI